MRRPALTLALSGAIACGGAVALPAVSPVLIAEKASEPSRRPLADTPVEIVTPPVETAMGALERPTALRSFFEALARLEDGRAEEDVLIAQLGDSHTAADVQTAIVRGALQSHFGDGGRGFVAIGQPWKHYRQAGVRGGMSGEWAPERTKYQRGKLQGDGMYGLSGIAVTTHKRGARAWADLTTQASRAELWYLEQPGGGALEVLLDGDRVALVSTRSAETRSAFYAFDLGDAARRQIEVRAVGDGAVRVFGLSLDRAEHGVVLDALGINGARVSTALSWDEQHFEEQLRRRSPALVVFAYGTNESTDIDMPQDAYERQLAEAIGRVARAVPNASCLLLGPPDRAVRADDGWVTAPKIAEIIAAQQNAAEAAGCAFYDQQAAMGGDGSIAAWAEEDPPRAHRDRCHLTREGYAELGGSFASDLLRAYGAWRGGAQSAGGGVASAASKPLVSAP